MSVIEINNRQHSKSYNFIAETLEILTKYPNKKIGMCCKDINSFVLSFNRITGKELLYEELESGVYILKLK